jgi:hypothetical protein
VPRTCVFASTVDNSASKPAPHRRRCELHGS